MWPWVYKRGRVRHWGTGTDARPCAERDFGEFGQGHREEIDSGDNCTTFLVSWRAPVRLPYGPLALASFLLFCVMVIPCQAQARDALCSNGSSNFEAEFHTGVKLRLGAARKAATGLATRVCEATLSWVKQAISVTP